MYKERKRKAAEARKNESRKTDWKNKDDDDNEDLSTTHSAQPDELKYRYTNNFVIDSGEIIDIFYKRKTN